MEPITDEDIDSSFMKYKTQRMLASAPPEYLERVARKAIPNITEEQLARVLKGFEYRLRDFRSF